ncbi:Uncharacterized [Syntrophomonas zehnderi OL-4]|uniref:Uncharacterized n=1 Tax=Syntrophomonas zehnderi OL-4 TaxID=690567 RepID=A0A0E3W3R3_9FIRM|nr:hypothetical protein [Syntrophomonas zehnderi]CFY00131.1 Uncharacterized [Syntrophomonas zehnderi OL-4]
MGLKPSAEEWIFLKNTGLGYELEILSSLLEQYDIPVLKKESAYTRLPTFIMGESTGSYNIYVPASKIEEAREIIANQPIEQVFSPTQISGQEKPESEPLRVSYQGINKLLLVLIIILIIAGLIIAAINL